MPSITIRPLKKSDAPQVALLIVQLTKNIVEPHKLQERIASLCNGGNQMFFVACQEEKVLGFAGLVWYAIASKGLMGWIEEVVVDADHRGEGIAQMLIEKLLDLAQKKELVQVKLTTANGNAKSLYERSGFIDKNEVLMVKQYYN